MAQYRYRCRSDGPFDVSRPIGTAPQQHPCPHCAQEAPRSISAPMLSFAPRSAMALVESAERSAHEPAVVGSPPARRRAASVAPQNPALHRLPRP